MGNFPGTQEQPAQPLNNRTIKKPSDFYYQELRCRGLLSKKQRWVSGLSRAFLQFCLSLSWHTQLFIGKRCKWPLGYPGLMGAHCNNPFQPLPAGHGGSSTFENPATTANFTGLRPGNLHRAQSSEEPSAWFNTLLSPSQNSWFNKVPASSFCTGSPKLCTSCISFLQLP